MKRIVHLLLLGLLPAWSPADQAADAARKIHLAQRDSVVWVIAVVEIEASGGGRTLPAREEKLEVLGTVVDKSGLTVVSYSSIDPTVGINNRKVPSAHGSISISATLKFKEVKLQLGDGTEIPADILIKDTDLDIAFIQPDQDSEEAEDVEFTPADLGSGAEPGLLDQVVVLSRQNKYLSRAPSVSLGRITSMVKKPRTFYQANLFTPGAPVFAIDGKLIGISVRRIAGGMPMMPVVLPAGDVREIAEQAREKSGKKSESTKP